MWIPFRLAFRWKNDSFLQDYCSFIMLYATHTSCHWTKKEMLNRNSTLYTLGPAIPKVLLLGDKNLCNSNNKQTRGKGLDHDISTFISSFFKYDKYYHYRRVQLCCFFWWTCLWYFPPNKMTGTWHWILWKQYYEWHYFNGKYSLLPSFTKELTFFSLCYR